MDELAEMVSGRLIMTVEERKRLSSRESLTTLEARIDGKPEMLLVQEYLRD